MSAEIFDQKMPPETTILDLAPTKPSNGMLTSVRALGEPVWSPVGYKYFL